MKENIIKYSVFGLWGGLYILVAAISLICSVDFFAMSHSTLMSWVLATGFELGAMSCLVAIVAFKRPPVITWIIFVLLTLFQMMGNSYHAYAALDNYQGWIELFGLVDLEVIEQKRILAIISGAILPIVALSFAHSLTTYLNKKDDDILDNNEEQEQEKLTEGEIVNNSIDGEKEEVKPLKKKTPKPKKEVDVIEEPVSQEVEEEDEISKKLKMAKTSLMKANDKLNKNND